MKLLSILKSQRPFSIIKSLEHRLKLRRPIATLSSHGLNKILFEEVNARTTIEAPGWVNFENMMWIARRRFTRPVSLIPHPKEAVERRRHASKLS